MARRADGLRIGVLGAARITPKAIVRPAQENVAVSVVAAAARDRERAQRFARKHGIPRVHGDYESLLRDDAVDAVYNPLPNGWHGAWTLAAIEAGKHVLCEKPFTANADEARTVADAARQSGLVVAEAFHYRYHPLGVRMKEIVDSGELGALRRVSASCCFPLPRFGDVRYDYSLAGGALMDAGCYAAHIIRLLGGAQPEVTTARAKRRTPEIDRAMYAELAFPGGYPGALRCSMWSTDLLRVAARAVGDNGELHVLNPIFPQSWHRLSVRTRHGTRVEHFPRRTSYAYQLDAFVEAVRDGDEMLTPPDDAVANMTLLDAIYRAADMPLRVPSGDG